MERGTVGVDLYGSGSAVSSSNEVYGDACLRVLFVDAGEFGYGGQRKLETGEEVVGMEEGVNGHACVRKVRGSHA